MFILTYRWFETKWQRMYLHVFKKRIHRHTHTDKGMMVLSWDDTSEQRSLALVLHNSLSQLYKSPSVWWTQHSPSSLREWAGVLVCVCVCCVEWERKKSKTDGEQKWQEVDLQLLLPSFSLLCLLNMRSPACVLTSSTVECLFMYSNLIPKWFNL